MVLSNSDGCVPASCSEAKALGIDMGDAWHVCRARADTPGAGIAFQVTQALLASGPLGIWGNIHKCSNETQKCLMFRTFRLRAQECAQFDGGKPPSRGSIWLMDNKRMAVLRLPPEKPTFPVGAAV